MVRRRNRVFLTQGITWLADIDSGSIPGSSYRRLQRQKLNRHDIFRHQEDVLQDILAIEISIYKIKSNERETRLPYAATQHTLSSCTSGRTHKYKARDFDYILQDKVQHTTCQSHSHQS